ncbi:MAG: hypothetical protein Tsb005_01780 [Gammaproteobacteria bacterium]
MAQHQQWLQQGAKPNTPGRLILCNTNLAGLNFAKADLRYADFHGSDLQNTYFDNADLTEANLQQAFLRWASLRNSNFTGANLTHAILQNTVATDANFRQAKLNQAKLNSADFTDSDFASTYLIQADLSYSNFKQARFQWSHLMNANLSHSNFTQSDFSEAKLLNADLRYANLTDSNFYNSNLSAADLSNAIVKDAIFTAANLKNTLYQPQLESLPNLVNFSMVKNFRQIQFNLQQGAPALVALRSAYEKIGMRAMERQITALIKTHEMRQAWQQGGWGYLESSVNYLLFYLTSDYGAQPGRPLQIFMILLFLCALPYAFAIVKADRHNGIILKWLPKNNITSGDDHQCYRYACLGFFPVLHHLSLLHKLTRLIRLAIYFSLLTSFEISLGEEINFSQWISRIQKRQYSLHGTGWIRTLAGAQSLLCIYLVVLWALVYFGRPFEW